MFGIFGYTMLFNFVAYLGFYQPNQERQLWQETIFMYNLCNFISKVQHVQHRNDNQSSYMYRHRPWIENKFKFSLI